MGPIDVDWEAIFGYSSPDSENSIYLGSPSSAPHAAATRAGLAGAKRARARAGAAAKVVARASSADKQPRGTQALHPRLEALCSELERRVGELERRVGELRPVEPSPVTRAAAKEAADRGQDAHSAAENVPIFNQQDGQGGHGACKYWTKPSPVLVGRKQNHEQADGDRKRVARPAANDNKEPAPPEEIFQALREIPSLDQADLLRAYSMLIRDDRLFRSLTALPKDMRKKWLVMEIGNQ